MSVCYNCSERAVGCHGNCLKYLEEAKSNESRLQARRKRYKEYSDIIQTRKKIMKKF